MPSVRHLALALAAGCLLAAPPRAEEAAPASVPMEALVMAVGAWIAAEFELASAPPPPEVLRAPAERLAALRATDAGAAMSVLALYEPAAGRIYLRSDWTGDGIAEISVLVHEMVHHAQHVTGRRFACPGAAEAEAYALQARWLGHFGASLDDLGVDPLMVRILGACGL